MGLVDFTPKEKGLSRDQLIMTGGLFQNPGMLCFPALYHIALLAMLLWRGFGGFYP